MASSSSSGGAFNDIMPSASTFVASSSGTKHPPFDVFINHCGQDVKPTIASRIYESLNATGLKVFLDKPELVYGDLLPKALEEAMNTASIYIAIFSEHYAESPWCLAELEYMVKSSKTIIPVFYRVDPFDLKHTVSGAETKYAEAFRQHQKKDRYSPEVLQRWKETLHQASFCIGGIIKNIDDEEKVVKHVVNRVTEMMKTVPLEVAKHPVGLDEAVQDFNTTVRRSAGSIRTVGIWGMGGSGKTTLAKEIFNRTHSTMHWSSFLSDVRDAAATGNLIEKQKTLLKDLEGEHLHYDSLDKGKQTLKNRLSRRGSVLIVLDDVDRIDQLDGLLPPKESFDSLADTSLIIVTTRNADVLRQWDISTIYKMGHLNDTHAEQLFCRHAFKQNVPSPGFEDLVKKFLTACRGLPLSLKVLGALLYGISDKNYWLQMLDKVSQIPHEDVQKTLRISYDALEPEHKEMFLDAACLFIGKRRSAAIAAWDAEFYGTIGWHTLLNRCLVEEDKYGLISMHDHLRDLGRDIANGQSPYRLWSPQQIINIPPQQEAIRVRGIANAAGDNCYHRQGKIILNTNQGERSLAPSSRGLKIFIGNGGFLRRELCEAFKELIWLQCTYFEHKNLPPWLALKNLRILALFQSDSLQHLWAEDADAPLQLRELVIRDIPSFEGFPSSIGRLKNLKKILINDDDSFTSCELLRDLPQEFCSLESLEHLDLRRCKKLSSLPINFGKLTNLRHLDLTDCKSLEALPDTFKKLTLLEYLNLRGCEELAIKSESNVFENMTKLRYLNLEICEKWEESHLPESLEKLSIIRNPILDGLRSLAKLTSLKQLKLFSCDNLKKIESLEHLKSLEKLDILVCTELQVIPSLPETASLKELRVYLCDKLEKVKGLGNLRSLEKLKISVCPRLDELLGLAELTSLKEIELEKCYILKKIESLEHLKSLEKLNISDCTELKVLASLPKISSLGEFRLESCPELEKVGGLENIRSLEMLTISDCPRLDLATLTSMCNKLQIIELHMCNKLQIIELHMCNKLDKIRSLENIRLLEKLKITDCSELVTIVSDSETTTALKEILLRKCHKLERIEGFKNMRSLEKLVIDDCPELKGFPGLAELTSLQEIDCSGSETLPQITSLKILELRKCPKLKKFEGLGNMRSLEELTISDCLALESLPNLSVITSLKLLHLENCYKLEKIGGVERLGRFDTLKVHIRWNARGTVSIEHSERLLSLDVVANDISAVEPFVSNIQQKWPRRVMICTRPVCDVGLLKNFFQNLPDVTVYPYRTHKVVRSNSKFVRRNCFEWSGNADYAHGDANLRCFIIDFDHPDLLLSIEFGDNKFYAELGEGKWVWMRVSTEPCWSPHFDNISARDINDEDVEVRVEAAWLVTGEEGSIVEAFRQLFLSLFLYSDEGRLLKKIVNPVMKHMKKKKEVELKSTEHLIGFNEIIGDFEAKIPYSSDKVNVVGIVGDGGSGKTTLAKELYHKKISSIDKHSFLFDVRDAAHKTDLYHKQKKLIKDIGVNSCKFDDIKEGKKILQNIRSQVLIILDDVDHPDQLDALLPEIDNLGQGSLVIVTSSELRVLQSPKISSIYHMKRLNGGLAEKLLCLHAFLQRSAPDEFQDLVKEFVQFCNGLPLLLKIFGGLLNEKSKEYWKSQLNKGSKTLPHDIKGRLRISFDALDEEEQDFFLDIACFFIGEDKSLAIAVWDGLGRDVMHSWEVLESKCLVEVDEHNQVKMHHQLRDMGRDIAKGRKPFRVWSSQGIADIQKQTTHDIEIRGLVNVTGASFSSWQGKIITNTNEGHLSLGTSWRGVKFFVGSGQFPNEEDGDLSRELLWLRWNDFHHPNLPPWLSMKKLRVLQLNGALNLQELWKDDAHVPSELRQLIITGTWSASFGKFPNTISHLKHLEKVALLGCVRKEFSIKGLPEEFCDLQSLEHLELRHCNLLCTLPTNFGNLRKLRYLDLCSCEMLRKLPPSFKGLINLEHLDLSNCKKLIPMPDILENMTELKNLYFSGCSKLQELPLQITNQKYLRELHLKKTMLMNVPNNIYQLSQLETLVIGSPHLRDIPVSLGNLPSLCSLKITGCIKLESLPEPVGRLKLLEYLFIKSSGVRSLPKGFWQLPRLQYLKIIDCPISELDFGSGSSLKELKAIHIEATYVRRLSSPQNCCPNLETLQLERNNQLLEIDILSASVKKVRVYDCPVLCKLKGLERTETLEIFGCPDFDADNMSAATRPINVGNELQLDEKASIHPSTSQKL